MYEFIGIGIQPSVVKVKELSEGTKVAFDDFFDEFGISEILEVLFLFFCHFGSDNTLHFDKLSASLAQGTINTNLRIQRYAGLTEDNRQPMVTNKLIKTNLLNS